MNIKIHDQVIVPDPSDSDPHNHSFVGTVKSVHNIYAEVEDMEEDCFTIEIQRLTLYS